MNSDKYSPISPPRLGASHRVSLSPYVNEQFPNWEEMLSAHDVARLTRRPRWMVLSLALLGRFPRKRRFHGRDIGWLRPDVVRWLSKDLRASTYHVRPAQTLRPRVARQTSLPPECTDACMTHRSRSRPCMLAKDSRHE
jgi:predicted DNA-binding transcriptional regulator AlpA